MIALAAGEIQNPPRTIPRVARMIFYRLVGFYIVGALAVSIICSSRDEMLISAIADGSSGAAASPWVMSIQNLGIGFLPHFINALILVSGLSCGNAYLFASSRTLYGLTRASNSAMEVFFWSVDLTTTAFIASYSFMLLAYIGFYRTRKAQGLTDESLYYVAPCTPYTPIMALALGCTVILFVGFNVFSPFSLRGFITSYFAVGFTEVMYLVGKIKYWREGRGVVNPKNADLITGEAEIDEERMQWEEGAYGFEEGMGVLPLLPIADIPVGAVGVIDMMLALLDAVQLEQEVGLYLPETVKKIQDTYKFEPMTPDLHVEELLSILSDSWVKHSDILHRGYMVEFETAWGKSHNILSPIVQ
ncbi:hypothetical protein LZL87_012428 [Fusarium oxysporum]|nr:hypothetical protein LZL87_012428 [Fusarium oxysporum]